MKRRCNKLIVILFAITIIGKKTYAQDTVLFDSKLIPWRDTVLVYLPENYSSDNKYPAVFMLHGWTGNYSAWGIIANLHFYAAAYNMIIITPNGFYDSWYVNSPLLPNYQYETYFFEILYPSILKKYSIDSNNVFITGLSMGGHGAMTLFLKRPDLFKAAGSTSGILDITKFPSRYSIKSKLGEFQTNGIFWKKNSAYILLNRIKNLDKQIIFDCGTEDFAYEVNKSFYEKCLKLKIKATFISRPGKHDKKHWRRAAEDHLYFFYRIVNNLD